MWSFRLVLGDKTGKEIPKSSRLEFLEKFLASNFALPDAEDNTGRSLNRVDIANLTFFEKIINSSMKVPRFKFLGSDGLFCFIIICKFAASGTLLHRLLACLNFTLVSEDFFC